jgi:50S ribosomal protein L16 3-hydroxylase
MDRTLLGGLSPATFLQRHWQREARLVRGAIPGFTGPLGRDELFRLAARDDVESRLVVHSAPRRWSLQHGPFRPRNLASLPDRNWTLLVQGVNLHDAAADAVLRRFDFISYARLDDLMVSYAVPGGGVGPHFDSYDVFLLQGFGRRRWKVSATGRRNGERRNAKRAGKRSSTPDDLEFEPGLPLRILRRFRAENEWELGPGDMLYLPPHYAHDGVALEPCTTWSIGFRAPSAQQLATGFLEFLQDRIALAGRYEDPGLRPAREPARIAPAMQRRLSEMLAALRWDASLLAEFAGCLLSEPKPNVFFPRPEPAMPKSRFAGALRRHGVRLDLRTQMLYDGTHLFVNGDALRWASARRVTSAPRSGNASSRSPSRALPIRAGRRDVGDQACAPRDPALVRLANDRALPAQRAPSVTLTDLLYGWYRDGYVHLDR